MKDSKAANGQTEGFVWKEGTTTNDFDLASIFVGWVWLEAWLETGYDFRIRTQNLPHVSGLKKCGWNDDVEPLVGGTMMFERQDNRKHRCCQEQQQQRFSDDFLCHSS